MTTQNLATMFSDAFSGAPAILEENHPRRVERYSKRLRYAMADNDADERFAQKRPGIPSPSVAYQVLQKPSGEYYFASASGKEITWAEAQAIMSEMGRAKPKAKAPNPDHLPKSAAEEFEDLALRTKWAEDAAAMVEQYTKDGRQITFAAALAKVQAKRLGDSLEAKRLRQEDLNQMKLGYTKYARAAHAQAAAVDPKALAARQARADRAARISVAKGIPFQEAYRAVEGDYVSDLG